MKKIFTFLYCFLLGVFTVEAQEIADEKITDKNLFYLEVGGRAILYSVNYERIIYQIGTHRFSVKGGSGYFPRITKKEFTENGKSLSVDHGILYFPLGVSWIKEISRNGYHFFEVGLTETFEIDPGYDIFGFQEGLKTRWVTIPSIGYRYQNPKGLLFSFAYTPHIGNENLDVWFGMSIGKSF